MYNTTPKMTLRTLAVNKFVAWRFASELAACAVCKIPCHELCPTCASTDSTCSLVKSKCGHVFHAECIHTWLTNNVICPLCAAPWEAVSLK
ncbi:RING-H2 zinc finger protein [Giardia duodenalis]|uniref:RING-H2 zinc finger protein n=2 Tax=Giardia intestinalis TaxID=5741 RepID=V6U542_GIAIN|nr:RING-H2 zinc finger protein [Giardia intestinalis]